MRVVITGANRGIGLELTRQYLARGAAVEATARDPDQASALSALAASGLRIHRLDVTDSASAKAFGAALGDVAVDVLINNAGVYGPSDRLDRFDFDEVLRTLDTNAVGALRVTDAVLPAMRRAGQASLKKIASITSGLGSIGDNSSGGSYGYRMSKAALNMAMRSLSVDLAGEGFTVVAVNPGWVQTDMGGKRAPTPVEVSCANIIALIERIGPTDSGQFFDHKGTTWPW